MNLKGAAGILAFRFIRMIIARWKTTEVIQE